MVGGHSASDLHFITVVEVADGFDVVEVDETVVDVVEVVDSKVDVVVVEGVVDGEVVVGMLGTSCTSHIPLLFISRQQPSSNTMRGFSQGLVKSSIIWEMFTHPETTTTNKSRADIVLSRFTLIYKAQKNKNDYRSDNSFLTWESLSL